jgi:NhaP-type Na+/H+ or K+/H+ antiporter
MLAQLVGNRWRIPALVPLLIFGVALGPSGLGVVRPAALGSGLSVIVKLAVAVILFDGALNLRLADLQRAIREVRNLVTIGVAVTWVGAATAAWAIAQLSVPVAIVFGALMTVTGPTVVQPLLRRVSLPRQVKTVLEGEAILIDPVGAVLAVAVVDIILGMTGMRPIGILGGAWAYIGRLLVGLVVGGVGGIVMSRILRTRGLVPGELVNLVSLAGVWGVFAIAEWLRAEGGITAAVAMGLAMQRGAVPEERRLRRFKEQLTVLGISLLFVLLAADLPLRVVRDEGWRGILTVLALMILVRPAAVWASLRRSTLSGRELAYISWISPRGIVAASVASLFALTLADAGFSEGQRLLAITFLTIAVTVTVQGLTAGTMARLLGLQSMAGRRVIIVGAGPLGVGLGDVLRTFGRPIVFVDRNAALVDHARSLGFDAREGNALDEEVLADAGAEEAETMIAVTTNSEVNAFAAHLAQDAFGIARALPSLSSPSHGAGPKLLERVGGRLAFGRPLDVRGWEIAIDRGEAHFVHCPVPAPTNSRPATVRRIADLPSDVVLLARARGGSVEVATALFTWEVGDVLVVLSRLSDVETRMLFAPEGARAPSTSPNTGAAPSRTGIV